MLIVGINGSPKKERSNTRLLLEKALEGAEEQMNDLKIQGKTQIVDLVDFEIRRCTGCDACVRKKPCPETAKDDMGQLETIVQKADAIIIGSPSYFTTVPGILKDFIDRSRTLKMQDHQLKNKIFGAITFAGLRYGGQEVVVDYLNRYALTQGMIVVGGLGSPIKDGIAGEGSLQTDDGKWRSSKEDILAIRGSQLLGKRVVEITALVGGKSE